MKLKHVRLLKKGILLSILILTAVIFLIIKQNKAVAEYFFARGTSRAFVFVFGNISNIFPFSLFELFVTITVIISVIWLIQLIKSAKKRKGYNVAKIFLNMGIYAFIILNVYTLAAGGNYFREKSFFPFYQGEQLTKEQTVKIIDYFWEDYSQISQSLEYDSSGKSLCPYSYEELYVLINAEYKKLSVKYPYYYNTFSPAPKKAVYSFFMSHEGISGVTFMPFGEANVNYQTPQCYQSFTTAHEIAHVKGIMTEREANLLASYVLISSDIPYLRYCGYMYSIVHVAELLYYYDKDAYTELYANYPVNARIEKTNEVSFWQDKSSFIGEIGNFFNDLYLKLSGAKDGVGSYIDNSQIIIPDEEESEVIIYYSDTARMLIELAKDALVE